jgi:hypothetical protein
MPQPRSIQHASADIYARYGKVPFEDGVVAA